MMALRVALLSVAIRVGLWLAMVGTWLDRRFRFRKPFPRDPGELRARRAWCVEALRAAGAIPVGAEVTGFEVEDIKQSEAFRSRVASVRLTWSSSGGPDGRLALVAKFAPFAASLRDHAVYILQKNHLKEVGFCSQLAATPGVSAPRVFYARADSPSGHFCILMEHLDALEVPEADGCPPALAAGVVTTMAALHAAFWGRHERAPAAIALVPDTVIAWFASRLGGPHRALRARVLSAVWRHDSRPPTTVLHGDLRVGNVLFTGEGRDRPVFIDWQAARKGKAAFDLAYFLVLSLEPEVRRAHAEALLDRYHAALTAHGVTDYPREALADDYRLAVPLVIAFASLPWMSGEASVTAANQTGLDAMAAAWSRRARAAAQDVDLGWLGGRLGIPELALQRELFQGGAELEDRRRPQ